MIKNKNVILDYVFSDIVKKNLLEINYMNISYFVIDPADIALMKMVNPRDEKEFKEAQNMLKLSDMTYLRKRIKECGVDDLWLKNIQT